MLHPRARMMLLLSTPALIIGIASSLVLIVVMKVAFTLQQFLWRRLPVSVGIAQDSPVWVIGMLTLTGIMVGLVIRYSHGHTGPDPICKPLIDIPVPTSTVPDLLVALILGLAGGISLSPEHPIMIVNIALAVAFGSRMFPRIARLDWTVLASTDTIGALFGTPIAAALIFSQTLNDSNGVPLWDRLFAPLMAAAAGPLITNLFFHPRFLLSIAHYTQMHSTDILSDAVVTAVTTVAGMVVVWCLPRLHHLTHRLKHPALILGTGGFILGILSVIGGPLILLKGLDEMQQMAFNQTLGISDYFMFTAIKLAALVVAAASGFRGGRIFPAVSVGVALGLTLHARAEAVSVTITVSCSTLRLVLVVIRDAWLNLFMAAVMVPDLTLLSLLCTVMLPAWLLLAGKPMMVVERPDK